MIRWEEKVLTADDPGARRVLSNCYFDGRIISGDEAKDFTLKWGWFRMIVLIN